MKHEIDPEDLVTARSAIISLLTQAKRERALFCALVPGISTQFNTSILGVYPPQGILALDELTPPQGHLLLQQAGELRLHGRLNGAPIRFRSRVRGVGEQSGIAFYKMEIPAQVQYLQLRQYHRVQLPAGQAVFRAEQVQRELQAFNGHLHDISMSGVGLTLQGSAPLQQCEVIPTCSLHFPGEVVIVVSLEVRHVSHKTRSEVVRVGARFLDLDNAGRSALGRIISELERQRARRLSEGR